MAKKLSNIQYAFPIESISRKFTLRKYVAGANLHRFFIGNLRNSAAFGGIQKNFVSVRFNGRTTPPSAAEMAQHTKFRTIQLAVSERIEDLMVITQDQSAYVRYRKKYGDKFPYGSLRTWLVGMGFKLWNDSTHSIDWPAGGNWPENMPGMN